MSETLRPLTNVERNRLPETRLGPKIAPITLEEIQERPHGSENRIEISISLAVR